MVRPIRTKPGHNGGCFQRYTQCNEGVGCLRVRCVVNFKGWSKPQRQTQSRNFARKRLLECSYSVKCNGSQTICQRTRAMDLVVCAGCNCVLGSRPMLGRCFHIPSRLIVFSSYYIAVLYESTLMSKFYLLIVRLSKHMER